MYCHRQYIQEVKTIKQSGAFRKNIKDGKFMKNSIKKIVGLILALSIMLTMALALVSCTGGKTEKIDKNRTQLYVFNYGGGYGVDWLYAVKERFEERHKDTVINGKTGVQVMITHEKKLISNMYEEVLDNTEEIYFTEYAYYYALLERGLVGDITDAVTGDLSEYGDAAGSTIEGKLTDVQKEYYNVDGKYYGVPHYAGYSGLIYNVELFDNNNYYFRDGYTDEDIDILGILGYFVNSTNTTKSAGPDGQLGTSDDGLPATYEEFDILCKRIQQDGNIPIIWNGNGHSTYVANLADALAADYEGLEQRMLNYTLNGTVTTAGTIVNGEFVRDSASTNLADDPYAVFRQEGKYRALSFIENIIDSGYLYGDSFNTGLSHTTAQNIFLYAGYEGTQNIAMLCEGIWWESEATDVFTEMVRRYGSEEYSKNQRQFGFMPMPKADESLVGKNTLQDNIYSMCFMKSNIADYKKDLAIDFIKFVNSDESLKEFTTITNTPKALNYTMTEAEMANMSPFGRSVMNLKLSSDIVYPFSSSETYKSNQAKFYTFEMWWTKCQVKVGTSSSFSEIQFPSRALYETKSGITGEPLSAEEYFSGLVNYYRGNTEWSAILGK